MLWWLPRLLPVCDVTTRIFNRQRQCWRCVYKAWWKLGLIASLNQHRQSSHSNVPLTSTTKRRIHHTQDIRRVFGRSGKVNHIDASLVTLSVARIANAYVLNKTQVPCSTYRPRFPSEICSTLSCNGLQSVGARGAPWQSLAKCIFFCS